MSLRGLIGGLLTVLVLAGCERAVIFHERDSYPVRLSDWHVVWREGDSLRVNESVLTYAVATPLFSDYAMKLRTIYVPPELQASYRKDQAFDFPVGSIVSKTFYYERAHADSPELVIDARSKPGHPTAVTGSSPRPREISFRNHRVMETRLLVRQPDGWDALPYIWDGDDAYLSVTGKVLPARLEHQEFAYVVPTRNECGACHVANHTSRDLRPLGLTARQLDHGEDDANPLQALRERNWIKDLPHEDLISSTASSSAVASLDARARAYLDANCGHCHHAGGAADTSGLLLDASVRNPRHMGLCKPTIAAGSGTGGRSFGIVPGAPDASVLLYRMTTTDPAARMPELGRALVHTEGVALIRSWIAAMPGGMDACIKT